MSRKTTQSDILAAMLMVIFGAGASYDSAQAYPLVYSGGASQNFGASALPVDQGGPWRPPLANDLFLNRDGMFGAIVAKYPKLSHILARLRSPSSERSVEQTLESLQEQGKNSPETQRELASVRYYLCEFLNEVTEEWSKRTNGATNYAPLIREVLRFNKVDERACLVTFNYDLLLERALYSFDFRRKVPAEHLDSHPILKLFKLHGSADWSRLVDLPRGSRLAYQGLIEQADTIRLSDEFVLARAWKPEEMFNFDRPIFPAIAIPVQTKTEQNFECPLAHREYLAKMLPNITKILIVGWQAKEAHFLQMLRQNLPGLTHLMVVGKDHDDSNTILRYFLRQVGKTSVPRTFYGEGGFTHFVVNHEGEEFLGA